MNYAFCSNKITENINTALKNSGVDVICIPDCAPLPAPTRSHADMLCFKINKNLWVMEKSTYEKLEFIPPNIKVLTDSFINMPELEYPYDIRFNAALIGKILFCKEEYISPVILENTKAKIVDVNQGYAKCSICQVNEYSFITADPCIKKAGEKNGFDVLMISQGNILLNGYDYGFIGGASALYNNKLFFFGDITRHPDYNAIHDFVYSRGVEEVILSKDTLYDYGGLLFV